MILPTLVATFLLVGAEGCKGLKVKCSKLQQLPPPQHLKQLNVVQEKTDDQRSSLSALISSKNTSEPLKRELLKLQQLMGGLSSSLGSGMERLSSKSRGSIEVEIAFIRIHCLWWYGHHWSIEPETMYKVVLKNCSTTRNKQSTG